MSRLYEQVYSSKYRNSEKHKDMKKLIGFLSVSKLISDVDFIPFYPKRQIYTPFFS